jgi:hypothetical protein
VIERKTRKIIAENECPTALMQHGSKLTGELRLIEVRQLRFREPSFESCPCCDGETVAALGDKFGTTRDVGSMQDGPAGYMPFDQGEKTMTPELVPSRSERLLPPSAAVSHQKSRSCNRSCDRSPARMARKAARERRPDYAKKKMMNGIWGRASIQWG